MAMKADPSYPTILQQRDALATELPIYEVHVRFTGSLLRAVQAPVTEVDFYKTTDERVDPGATPAAETQEMIRRVTYRVESLQSPGFVSFSWGVALEDATRGVNLNGWRSIEVRPFVLPQVLPFVPTRARTTCVWVHWKDTRYSWKRPKRYSIISPSSPSRT
jgi:hypothetical protein